MVAQVWGRGKAQDLPLSSIVVMAPPTEDSNTQGSTRGKSARVLEGGITRVVGDGGCIPNADTLDSSLRAS